MASPKNPEAMNNAKKETARLDKNNINNTAVYVCYVIPLVIGFFELIHFNEWIIAGIAWISAVLFNGIVSVTPLDWEPTSIKVQEAYWGGFLVMLFFGSIVWGINSNRQNKIS